MTPDQKKQRVREIAGMIADSFGRVYQTEIRSTAAGSVMVHIDSAAICVNVVITPARRSLVALKEPA